MEVLVIGNGFDIAHGLPTKYENFLDYMESFINIYCNGRIGQKGALYNVSKPKYESIDRLRFENEELATELYNMIRNNRWISYIVSKRDGIGDTWIDFERVISSVICPLEKGTDTQESRMNANTIIRDLGFDLSDARSGYGACISSYIKDELEHDLMRLIRALEIYISFYVDNLEVADPDQIISEIHPDRVLSFNYSNTYERLYSSNLKNGVSFLHGKADVKNSFDSCKTNIVLGINDELDKMNEDDRLDFISFKKYYQRIVKSTDNSYLMWCDQFAEDWNRLDENDKENVRRYISNYIGSSTEAMPEGINCVRIFGHSLDVTDKDVLRRLICNDNTRTVIYYHDKSARERQVRNLVRVIGKEELIKRTGGLTRTICFVPQHQM